MAGRIKPDPDFLKKQPPPNYVAGLGRGATGFTTRSDVGGALISEEQETEKPQDPENETGLFDSLPYEADDEEADRIYEAIDLKMQERRKTRREAREKEELARLRKENPTIQQQFSDLKRGLSSMTDQDWAEIPEVGDLTRKKGKKSKSSIGDDRFSAVPDSIVLNNLRQTGILFPNNLKRIYFRARFSTTSSGCFHSRINRFCSIR
jgi:pre-mRNA-processing factor 6